MRPLQAHCHRGLGMLHVTIGQQEQARTELSAAIVLYHAMDMTFWLPQTEAALAQVEGQEGPMAMLARCLPCANGRTVSPCMGAAHRRREKGSPVEHISARRDRL